MKRLFLMLVSVLLAGLPQAQAASFDCAKARTRVEKLICGDGTVSGLDDQLGRAFKQLAAEVDAAALRQDQLAWMAERNRCADASCLARSYRARLQRLASWRQDDPNPGQLSGLYGTRRPNGVFNPDTQQYEPLQTVDCLSLRRKSDSEIEFHLALVGGNIHTCEMSGVARKVDASTYEYREMLDGPEKRECRLSIHVRQGFIELKDAGLVCRQDYCGARAGIDGVGFARGDANAGECRRLNEEKRR
ncbi:lysozyme inhibitor LprI family protein [Azohydromonas caseinilytica]|uniref:Lysozyme inhibitor LprI N-terminal domain-containing protein n=1 Tax=Azohydromonas caseinilytica TaxID=2728836 RepID=A0A848F8K2_9BURK|nr:hypothetical protein [Azohydromonas caseinilytica]NML15548.1 hypothetical protein [Azohydromonas caseinilytica]